MNIVVARTRRPSRLCRLVVAVVHSLAALARSFAWQSARRSVATAANAAVAADVAVAAARRACDGSLRVFLRFLVIAAPRSVRVAGA